MFSPASLEDLSLLRETVELECTLAQPCGMKVFFHGSRIY